MATIDPTEERTVAAGDILHGAPLEIGGQLNLAGQAEIEGRDARASGIGEGFGSATSTRARTATASGVGDGVGAATSTRARTATASGVGEGFGTALSTRARTATASGTGEGFGTAVPTVFVPIIRREDTGLAWQEDESITLDTEAGGSQP